MRRWKSWSGVIAVTGAVAFTGIGGTLVLAAKGMSSPPTQFEVEISETEKGFDMKGWAFSNVPTKVIIRNKDHVSHGFTSPLFNEVPVRMEGQGTEVRGQNFKSFHLEPGKTMTLEFTAPSKPNAVTGQPEHQYYVVWCDLHPTAKGELHIVETHGEIGGG